MRKTAFAFNAFTARLFCLVVAFTLALTIAGCGGGGSGSGTTGTPQTPVITWPAPAAITVGTALSSTQLNATANVAGTFAYNPAAGTKPAVGTQTLSVTFTPTDTVNYTNATDSVQLTVTAATAPTPTITATPSTITLGQTVNVVWNVTGVYSSVSVSGPGLTASSSASGNATVTPPTLAPASAPAAYVITANYAGGSVSATATVVVNALAPTGTLTPSAISITAGSSLTLALVTTNATACSISATDKSATGTVPCNGTIPATPTITSGTVTYTVTATGSGGSVTLSSGPITVTSGQIQLTSITPRAQWCIGQCEFPTITLYGANFAVGELVNCTPDCNIQFVNLISSTKEQVTLGIDGYHEGSGDRSLNVSKSDGTGASATLRFGLYSWDMCDIYPSTGERFCLNPNESVPGQNLYNGVPQKGYVDKFTANGTPDGNFYVGPGRSAISVDNVTGLVVIDGTPYDQNGGQGTVPILTGLYSDPITANAAKNGLMCVLQPTAKNNVGCVCLMGSSPTQNLSVHANAGTNPQSLAIGKVSGKSTVYVFSVGGTPALWSAEADTMANPVSQPVTGVTTEAPGGSAIAIFDSLNLGVVTSFGDTIAIPFSETTLMPVGNAIALPGTPVNVIADATDEVMVVGNAGPSDGTFTVVDPVKETTTTLSGTTPYLPVGITVDPAGGGFSTCPSDGTACTHFVL